MNKSFPFFLFCWILLPSCSNKTAPDLQGLYLRILASQDRYAGQLEQFRDEFGGTYHLPGKNFYLFGMGNRDKYLYCDGRLLNASNGEEIREWSVLEEEIVPAAYSVVLKLKNSGMVILAEDEEGIWLIDENERVRLNENIGKVVLPDFQEFRYGEIMKVLHQEILVNVDSSGPLPNYFVYRKPWRRDASMMAMCLSHTGNLALIRDWVLALDDPYDHNNGRKQGNPESEADNLGQTLYLISLFADSHHPLVPVIAEEMKKIEKTTADGSKYILGRSDFQEVPVYQTKWLKFGLRALGMEDPYTIPVLEDNYSSLFWWDFRDVHKEGNEWRDPDYPYIGWARDHFYGRKEGLISDRIYPLTWEKNASQADYEGMRLIDTTFVIQRIAAPHTWHAAEIFLYLFDINNKS